MATGVDVLTTIAEPHKHVHEFCIVRVPDDAHCKGGALGGAVDRKELHAVDATDVCQQHKRKDDPQLHAIKCRSDGHKGMMR